MRGKTVRMTVIFSGHVQGVGFRYQTLKCSQQFDVVGHVRNLADGTVELVAQGDRAVVENFHQAVEQRMAGNVKDRMVTWAGTVAELTEFEIQ